MYSARHLHQHQRPHLDGQDHPSRPAQRRGHPEQFVSVGSGGKTWYATTPGTWTAGTISDAGTANPTRIASNGPPWWPWATAAASSLHRRPPGPRRRRAGHHRQPSTASPTRQGPVDRRRPTAPCSPAPTAAPGPPRCHPQRVLAAPICAADTVAVTTDNVTTYYFAAVARRYWWRHHHQQRRQHLQTGRRGRRTSTPRPLLPTAASPRWAPTTRSTSPPSTPGLPPRQTDAGRHDVRHHPRQRHFTWPSAPAAPASTRTEHYRRNTDSSPVKIGCSRSQLHFPSEASPCPSTIPANASLPRPLPRRRVAPMHPDEAPRAATAGAHQTGRRRLALRHGRPPLPGRHQLLVGQSLRPRQPRIGAALSSSSTSSST